MKEDLDSIFITLKNILSEYVPPFSVKKPPEAIRKSGKKSYELISNKQVVIAGRSKDEVYFVGLIIQKDYVGYYYMAAYDKTILKELDSDFVKTLKGKTCFYIRDTSDDTLKNVRKSLKLGYEYYKKKGWV